MERNSLQLKAASPKGFSLLFLCIAPVTLSVSPVLSQWGFELWEAVLLLSQLMASVSEVILIFQETNFFVISKDTGLSPASA